MSTLPRRGSHSVFSIHLHLVFVTKYRRKVLTSAMLERMTKKFAHSRIRAFEIKIKNFSCGTQAHFKQRIVPRVHCTEVQRIPLFSSPRLEPWVISNARMRECANFFLTDILAGVCRKAKSVVIEFNGESDHVHLLIDLHPDNNISTLIGSLKSASSRILRQEESKHLEKYYWSKPVFWSGAYYVASSGGATIEKIKEYIQSQAPPD